MFRDWFNIPIAMSRTSASAPRSPQPPDAANTPHAPSPTQREGAFVTVQSLVSFPGALAAVTVIVTAVGGLVPAWSGKAGLFAIASLLVGGTIYYINESDPQKVPKSGNQKVIGIIIALINTFVIFTSAIGADALRQRSEKTEIPGPPPPAPNTETNIVG